MLKYFGRFQFTFVRLRTVAFCLLAAFEATASQLSHPRFADLPKFLDDEAIELLDIENEVFSNAVGGRPVGDYMSKHPDEQLAAFLSQSCPANPDAVIYISQSFTDQSSGSVSRLFRIYTNQKKGDPCDISSYEGRDVSEYAYAKLRRSSRVHSSEEIVLEQFEGSKSGKNTQFVLFLERGTDGELIKFSVTKKVRVRFFWQRWKVELENEEDAEWDREHLIFYDFAIGRGIRQNGH